MLVVYLTAARVLFVIFNSHTREAKSKLPTPCCSFYHPMFEAKSEGLWCKRQDLARYDVGGAAGGVGMGKLMGVEQLFEGRHFDREVIILVQCAGIFASS